MKSKLALSFLTLTSLAISTQGAVAQQIPITQTYTPSNRIPIADSTLNTQVSGAASNFDITGGLTKGQTLFHSFTDFSVPKNGQANFLNPVGNRDIITRVTGNLFSDINSIVNTNGANFFLINPNGIIFGTEAKLNVGQAFVGSTANSIDLVAAGGQKVTFGKSSNGDAPLLSVAPNVLFNVSALNMGKGSGAISNFGTLQTNNQSQYIGLIGGNVSLNGGKVIAPGGRVDLGGLNSAGTVSVNSQGLVFSGTGLERSNVTIANGASVSVRANPTLNPVAPAFFPTAGSPGSSINISANRIDVRNSGNRYITSDENPIINKELGGLDAGLEVNSGVKTGTIGNINLDATGDIRIQRGAIFNLVRSGTEGRGGKIKIVGNNITVTDKSEISTSLSENATGSGGDIEITARGKIDIFEPNYPDVKAYGDYAESLVNANTYGRGNSGKVKILAKGKLFVSDSNTISSTVEKTGDGNSSGIEINAGSLELFNGSQILSFVDRNKTGKKGNAGNIDIKTAGNITISGSKEKSVLLNLVDRRTPISKIASSTLREGNSGKITLTTPGKLSVLNRGVVWSEIREGGVGNSGGIALNIGELLLSNLSEISSSLGADNEPTFTSQGTAGDIYIKATGNITLNEDRLVISIEENNFAPSAISSSVFGTGNAGNITIETPGKISIGNRDIIGSTVEQIGQGNGGNIKINAGELEIFNQGQILTVAQSRPSVTGSEPNDSIPGNAGNISIKTTENITVSGNNNPTVISDTSASFLSKIASSNFRNGNAGKITIDAGGNISLLNRGGIITDLKSKNVGNVSGGINIKSQQLNLDRGDISVEATDNGGNLQIATRDKILIRDNSNITTSATNGKAGEIKIDSPQINLDNGRINARSNAGKGGNIKIDRVDLLLLRRGSKIATDAGGTAQVGDDGGNITIDSKLLIALFSENSDITANAVKGRGGNVTINAQQGLFGIQKRSKGQDSSLTNDITANSFFGESGAINLKTPAIDPGKNTTQLPTVTTDASNQISQVCSASNRQNKLTVAGRGGLPPTANDPLTGDVVWQDARAVSAKPESSALGWVKDPLTGNIVRQDPRAASNPAVSNATTNPVKIIPPAVGWVFDDKGKVTLIAAATEGQPTGTRTACPKAK